MIRIFLLFTSILLLLSGCSTPNIDSETSNNLIKADLAITDVDVFDSRSKEVLKDRTILINGDTISRIVSVDTPIDANNIIAGNNRLVTPGFIDTHAHLMLFISPEAGSDDSPLPELLPQSKSTLTTIYLQHGTTTIMDMGQPEQWLTESSNWQASNATDFPNVYLAGGSLISNQERPNPPHHIEIGDIDEINNRLDKYVALGIDRLKLYRKLELEDMQLVVTAAKERSMHVYAHTDNSVVTIQQAMKLGVKDFEHFFTVIPSVLDFRSELENVWQQLGIEGIRNDDEFAATMVAFFDYAKDSSEFNQGLETLFKTMASENASISTTINILASAARQSRVYSSFNPVPVRTEPDLPYSDEQHTQVADAFTTMMQYLKSAHDAGVKIRIGTDTRNGGEALLSELVLLAEAEFPIADILQIATLNGAEALHIDSQYGSVAAGMKADIIIFEKNPFAEPAHFFSKKTIIKHGEIFNVIE